jgi:hypothetical protein
MRSHVSHRHAPPPGLTFGEPDDRLLRGIQYAAAAQSNIVVCGILDRPVKPGYDGRESRTSNYRSNCRTPCCD